MFMREKPKPIKMTELEVKMSKFYNNIGYVGVIEQLSTNRYKRQRETLHVYLKQEFGEFIFSQTTEMTWSVLEWIAIYLKD
jgi:hypothetical protein